MILQPLCVTLDRLAGSSQLFRSCAILDPKGFDIAKSGVIDRWEVVSNSDRVWLRKTVARTGSSFSEEMGSK